MNCISARNLRGSCLWELCSACADGGTVTDDDGLRSLTCISARIFRTSCHRDFLSSCAYVGTVTHVGTVTVTYVGIAWAPFLTSTSNEQRRELSKKQRVNKTAWPQHYSVHVPPRLHCNYDMQTPFENEALASRSGSTFLSHCVRRLDG